jgi:hypothetical protein
LEAKKIELITESRVGTGQQGARTGHTNLIAAKRCFAGLLALVCRTNRQTAGFNTRLRRNNRIGKNAGGGAQFAPENPAKNMTEKTE